MHSMGPGLAGPGLALSHFEILDAEPAVSDPKVPLGVFERGSRRARDDRLTGTARQFGDIHVEGLRGEFQTFDRGEIGEDHLPQLGIGQALLDGEGRRLNAVGTLRRQNMGADQLAGRAIGDQLDQPAPPAIRPEFREIVSLLQVQGELDPFRCNPIS